MRARVRATSLTLAVDLGCVVDHRVDRPQPVDLIGHRPGLVELTSDQREEQRQMVEVNLLGAMTATKVFLDQLRDGGGDLVNIGRTARAGNAAYAAT